MILIAQSSDLHSAASLVQVIGDRVGTAAFAVSGALLAVDKKLDVVGIAVLAAVPAVGGGIIRDLIIDRHSPVAFTDPTYLTIAFVAAVLVALWQPPARLTGRPLDVADALGLGVFCVTGTATAARFGMGLPSAALLGVVTGVGGGVLRDVLAREIPLVLRPDDAIYAIPAVLGAGTTALLLHIRHYSDIAGALVILFVFILRVTALHYGWRAPHAYRRK